MTDTAASQETSGPAAAPIAPAATPAASAEHGDTVPPALSVEQGTAMPAATTAALGPNRTTLPVPVAVQGAPSPEPSTARGYSVQPPSPSEPPKVGVLGGTAAQPTSTPVGAPAPAPIENRTEGGSPVVLFGLLLGILGLAALALTWVARRVTKDPLLR